MKKRGPQQAAPGFFYPLALSGGMGLLIAGDGSEAVHLVAPDTAKPGAFATYLLQSVGGTVGTLALGAQSELGPGHWGLVVPDYDHDVLYFYAVEEAQG